MSFFIIDVVTLVLEVLIILDVPDELNKPEKRKSLAKTVKPAEAKKKRYFNFVSLLKHGVLLLFFVEKKK